MSAFFGQRGFEERDSAAETYVIDAPPASPQTVKPAISRRVLHNGAILPTASILRRHRRRPSSWCPRCWRPGSRDRSVRIMTSSSIRRQRWKGDAQVGRARLLPSFFRHRDRPQVLVDAKWPPDKAPQERRSPVKMDRTTKRCISAPSPTTTEANSTCTG